jgi:hypothetical protein
VRTSNTRFQKFCDDEARKLERCPSHGKVCFPSEREARRARSHKSARLRIYRCPDCDSWHLTKGIT